MRHATTLLSSLLSTALLAPVGTSQLEYEVRIKGSVEFNGVSSGPLANISSGDAAVLSFRVSDDDFINSPSFPTRGYRIDPATWSFAFPGGSVPIQNPYSAGELLFVIRNDDPAVDGFLVSSVVDFPVGVPLNVPGAFGPFENSFYVTYGQTLLPSLDIDDAVGDYDFSGLTVFNWTIDDGPFNPIGLIFEELRVALAIDGTVTALGCGTNPAGSIAVVGGSPSIGSTLEIGLDNPLGTQAAGSLAALFVAFSATPNSPCGIPLPGLGMSGPGAAGELLIGTSGPLLSFFASQPWGGPGSFATVPLALPDAPELVGVELYTQGAIIDPIGSSGVFTAL
ncbi:MAG: hypothetical protein ACYSWX_07985, partial [Planctomycetota bacterium]